MARRKPIEIEVVSVAKGDGFKKSEREGTAWAKKMGETGKEAGDKLAKGVDSGTSSVGDKLKTNGVGAGKKFSDGVDDGASGLGEKLKAGGERASEGFKNVLMAGGALAGAALVAGVMSHLD